VSAPVLVETASTTPHPAGGVVLLVHTEAGPGLLVFPPALARALFVITNPCAPKHLSKSDAGTGSPVARRYRSREERLQLFTALSAEIATHQGRFGAIVEVLRKHGISQATYYGWLAEFDPANSARTPVPKPSGALL